MDESHPRPTLVQKRVAECSRAAVRHSRSGQKYVSRATLNVKKYPSWGGEISATLATLASAVAEASCDGVLACTAPRFASGAQRCYGW